MAQSSFLLLSLYLGVLGQALSPVIMKDNPDNVPILNVITACPLALTLLSSFVLLRSAEPPTPPSRSAESLLTVKHLSLTELVKTMLKMVKNSTVLTIIIVAGSGGGMLSCLLTQLNQLMCSRNYTIEESSMTAVLNILIG